MSRPKTDKISAALLSVGALSIEQVDSILRIQKGSKRKFGEIAVAMGFIEESDLMSRLSTVFKMELVDLDLLEPPLEMLSNTSQLFWRSNLVAPISINSEIARVAIFDPLDIETIDRLGAIYDRRVEVFLASQSSIIAAIGRWYSQLRQVRESPALYGIQRRRSEEKSAVEIVQEIIDEAVRARASDIHVDPNRDGLLTRLRIDGSLFRLALFAPDRSASTMARLKVMAGVDIAETRLPQDGSFSGESLGHGNVEFRVATYPSIEGESMTIRLLFRSDGYDLRALGLNERSYRFIENALEREWGLIIVTGPTGSGKTTTLYTALERLSTPDRLLITIEDPVERKLANARQSEVNRRIGFTFAEGCARALRQDPDALMIGEIRDPETANVAIRAALTGHLCLSSMHTPDTVTAIERLIDLGIERYKIAATLNILIAQRLVRLRHEKCSARGCSECRASGYLGRSGLFETLQLDDELKRLIHDGASIDSIRRAALDRGALVTFAEAAKLKLKESAVAREELKEWLEEKESSDR